MGSEEPSLRKIAYVLARFGMYVVMAVRSAVPGVPVHSSPTAKRWRTSQNDVGGTRPMSEKPFAVKEPLTTPYAW